MICYVLAIGKQHLVHVVPYVVVGYGIKNFWPGLFITSPDHLAVIRNLNIPQLPPGQTLRFEFLVGQIRLFK